MNIIKKKLSKSEINSERNKAKRSENLFVASIIGIPILFFLVFWVYVNLNSFALAFQSEKYTSEGMQLVFTLDNFKNIIASFVQFEVINIGIALRNTLLFFVVGLVIVFPISILMAYFVYKKIFMYKLFRTITYLPNIICASALVVLFQYIFRFGGPYHMAIVNKGGTFEYLFNTDKAILLLLLYNVIFGFGLNMVVLGGAMNSISAEVLEAGNIDGCNWVQELSLLILPMIWPTISTILTLSFAGILSATGPILAMTQGLNDTQTLSFLLYALSTGAVSTVVNQDIYLASAIGLTMTLITFPLVLVVRKVFNRGDN